MLRFLTYVCRAEKYFCEAFPTYEVPVGNVSHGCIRVLPSAAKWLNEQFITIGTQVIVLSYADENGDGAWLQPRAQAQIKAPQPRQALQRQYASHSSRLKLRPRGRVYA